MNPLSVVRASVVLLLLGSSAHAQTPVTVQTDHGPVVGRESTVRSFLGIPYAAPPVGELRWKSPQPAAPWTAPRDASTFGNVCPQVVIALFARPDETPGTLRGQEDCLTLNVYTPSGVTAQSKLPVMAWIHGGSFITGSGAAYDGAVLAQKYGVVVVTMNYRLGALGWLSLPALSTEGGGQSGNYGLQDQQAALKWIQSNITAFGGDPAKVTVAGESAGGMSVCANLASPQSAGLFRGAIIQSGLCTSPGNGVTLTQAEARNTRYATNLGCSATDLACLRALDPLKVLTTKVPGLRPASALVWSPVYRNPSLPLQLRDAFESGQFNQVPVLNGTTHDEGRLFVQVASPDGKPISPVLYWGGTGLTVGVANTTRTLARYPYRRYDTPALAFATMFTDAVFSCTALRVNQALSKHVPVYAFEFNDPQAATLMKSPSDLPGLGSYHSSELSYVFQAPIAGMSDPTLFTPAQRTLSDALSAAWMTFVKTGSPAVAGDGWARFATAQGNVQAFTPTGVRPIPNFAADHQCEYWLPLNLQ
ncbi:para-nitrobenzyl esterase [Deinococcus metalli]|uniref:Carboxylic ester hydrolase n=1 Tax=Deinococcus metalli TaxID=1141878 RepID=A0A7W8KF06_9DEIO|nr:carboxylesterase family protein [Deinococcus metalli]MBB5376558.1 para-nitrobenzyl esterase [Deinococcus metalli]GHF43134.1 carboxylic ester hydrolase [Deinococcus metalli]